MPMSVSLYKKVSRKKTVFFQGRTSLKALIDKVGSVANLTFEPANGVDVIQLSVSSSTGKAESRESYPLWRRTGTSKNGKNYDFYSSVPVDLLDLHKRYGNDVVVTLFLNQTKKTERSPDASILFSAPDTKYTKAKTKEEVPF